MLTVGDQFPEFKLQAVVSLEDGREFEQVTNHTASGRWLVVFFWPMDFTFVCPTEIAEFGRRHPDFAKRGAEVLGVSTDTHYVHLAWRRQHPELRELPYPMLADIKRELASALGIVHTGRRSTRCCACSMRSRAVSSARANSARASPRSREPA